MLSRIFRKRKEPPPATRVKFFFNGPGCVELLPGTVEYIPQKGDHVYCDAGHHLEWVVVGVRMAMSLQTRTTVRMDEITVILDPYVAKET